MGPLDAYDLAEGLETFPNRRYASLHCFIDNLHADLRAELEELGDMTMPLPTGKCRLSHDEPSGIVRFMRDDLSTVSPSIKSEPGVAEASRRSRGDLVAAILIRSNGAFRFTFPLQWSCTWQKWEVYDGPLLKWLKTTLVPQDKKNGDNADDDHSRHPRRPRTGNPRPTSGAARSDSDTAIDGDDPLRRPDGATGMTDIQQTFAIIKPDAVHNGRVGHILAMAEREDLFVHDMSMGTPSRAWWTEFYLEHKGKPFFDGLIAFMSSGPSVFVILEGINAINRWRKLMGATDPKKAKPGTLRYLYGDRIGRGMPHNAVHGSDSISSAAREAKLWWTNQ